jgi:hypothetical protein
VRREVGAPRTSRADADADQAELECWNAGRGAEGEELPPQERLFTDDDGCHVGPGKGREGVEGEVFSLVSCTVFARSLLVPCLFFARSCKPGSVTLQC